MSESHVQRVMVVLAALLLALLAIFWPAVGKLVNPSQPIGSIFNLKPGIDMVGGTSLLYEIKSPNDRNHSTVGLSEKVMVALKKRVDPKGLRNLIWRPQGNNRLEIQMPFSGDTQGNRSRRAELAKEISAAQADLDATNIAGSEVTDAVEQKNGRTRADLPRLADGSASRLSFFNQAAKVYDDLQAAHKAQDADAEARLRVQYDALMNPTGESGSRMKNQAEASNLTPAELSAALDSPERKTRLADLKSRYADFPARLAAIDRYEKAYDQQAKLKGSIDDAEDLKRLLKGSGVLEFHILVQPNAGASGNYSPAEQQDSMIEFQKMLKRLQENGPRVEAGDRSRWYLVENPVDPITKQTKFPLLQQYDGKSYILAWTTPEKSLGQLPGQKQWALTGATPQTGQNGETLVAFSFDPQGGAYFGKLTGANIGRPMAIMLDNKVISAPNIKSQINDSGTIDGGSEGFSSQELDYLVNTLTAGSLPAQLADDPISEKTVGPQLGEANLRHGLEACALGLVVVAIFLIGYYYLAGVVAFFAVLMNVILILGVMAALNATFTLPSIAGIVLTIGTAVDANVLIFERLREEQHHGLSLRLALRNAYGKALSAIIDSNMTTVITSLALIWFGTEEVKGFGITLIIGICASLFTALFVTRTIFGILIDYCGVTKLGSFPLSFPKWDHLLRPNIDWMRLAFGFATFSLIAVGIGIAMFVIKAEKREMFAIDFASGTSVQFELKEPMVQEKLRALIGTNADPKILPDANPVDVTSAPVPHTVYDLTTPNADSAKVKDEILRVLGDRLKITRPSKFVASGDTFANAMANHAVIPLTKENIANPALWPGGNIPPRARDYLGGVAIVMNQLDPPLDPSVIKVRLTQQQLQTSEGSDQAAQSEFLVQAPGADDAPTASAVVLARNEEIPYDKDATQWEAQLASPTWKLVNDAIGRPAQLQRVETFDASVAGDTQRDALATLALSVVVIMAYIWIRFGNLKYGTATVVALLHDTIFTIAALGFAHYIFAWMGSVLEIKPFRVDLTVVAGILTIMGYSMIDTIVVFDRIRENRGKFGHVSRKVINDAVNQTLSRTLLTAGTTTVMVAIMYFFGGEGIHGFTFVLLVGILVGTYSSVAIAAPILLLGNRADGAGASGGSGSSTARPADQRLQNASA